MVFVELAVDVSNLGEVVEPVLQELAVLVYREVIVIGFEEYVVVDEEVCVLCDSVATYGRITKLR